MVDVTLSEAMQEAMAAASAGETIIDTISLYFDGLVDDAGNPTELYMFLGTSGDRMSPNGYPLKDFKLEDAAPHNAGDTIEFMGVPMDISFPDVAGQPTTKGQLSIDGVGRTVADLLLQAIDGGVSVNMTYRGYLSSNVLQGPDQEPIPFSLSNVTVKSVRVTGDIVVPTKASRRFPKGEYDADRFPTLAT